MSYETEIKLRISNVDYIEKKLKELGAKLDNIIEEEDYYIDLTPCVDIRRSDIALRIRKSKSLMKGDVVEEVTFKGKRLSEFPKVRKEITVNISSAEKMLEIFRELGFRNIYTIHKIRKVYILSNSKVFLDYVEELGYFMEIELLKPMDLAILKNELARLFTALNVSERHIERKTYLELLLEKRGIISS